MKLLFLAGFLSAGSIQSLSALSIPSHVRIYVDASYGFDIFLTAALEKNHVPLTVTTDKSKADFALEGSSDFITTRSAAFFTGTRGDDEASVRLVDLKSGDVIFAYSADRRSTVHRRQAAAESCAKHLGVAIGRATSPSSPRNGLVSTLAKLLQVWPSKDPALDF
jgi:hypothetical protein